MDPIGVLKTAVCRPPAVFPEGAPVAREIEAMVPVVLKRMLGSSGETETFLTVMAMVAVAAIDAEWTRTISTPPTQSGVEIARGPTACTDVEEAAPLKENEVRGMMLTTRPAMVLISLCFGDFPLRTQEATTLFVSG